MLRFSRKETRIPHEDSSVEDLQSRLECLRFVKDDLWTVGDSSPWRKGLP
jgi:hypothetical protein